MHQLAEGTTLPKRTPQTGGKVELEHEKGPHKVKKERGKIQLPITALLTGILIALINIRNLLKKEKWDTIEQTLRQL